MLEKFYPKKGKINFGLIYFHRFYRLTPTLLYVILLTIYVFPLLSSNLQYIVVSNSLAEGCEKTWWATVMYINNFYPDSNKACVGVTWYLANDM
jgi:peptidoglycan/LPS O-acetylase OafA/YrhL